ncbi:MAG: hypothetical protein EOO45_01120 [Flavobacterium sp.]|nr:MAG: hypothetical protein EOO45_01120 [Flavobacterium sp.]
MRFLKGNKKVLTARQEQLAGSIARWLLACQLKAAVFLNNKTADISGRGWLILLILFCAVFGGYCLLLIATALSA